MQTKLTCGTPSNQYMYNCSIGNPFKRSSVRCKDELKFPVNSNSLNQNSFVVMYSAPQWVTQNFSHLTVFSKLSVKAGWFIGWSKNHSTDGNLLVEPSCVSDSPTFRLNGSMLTPLNKTTGNCAFYLNVFLEKPNKMSALNMYSTAGVYQVSAGSVGGAGIGTLNQQVVITQQLTNVTIQADTSCTVNVPCNLTAITIGGYNVTFNWSSTAFSPISTYDYFILPTFSIPGNYLINLTAFDPFSDVVSTSALINIAPLPSLNYSLSLLVLNNDSINPLYSYISKRNLMLLFSTGPDDTYSCVLNIDYPIYFNKSIYANNSVINYQTNRDGVYNITLNCTYQFGFSYLNITQYIEDPITNVQLLNTSVIYSAAFRIMIQVSNGTSPIIEFWLNGNKDMGFVFASSTGLGLSSLYTMVPVGINNVTMIAYNNVSNLTTFDTLQVNYKILNPTLNCSSPVAYMNGVNYYYFGSNISCILDMQSGSNILLQAYTGDESSPSIPAVNTSFSGQWSHPYYLSHVYQIPGDYLVSFVINNGVSQFRLNRSISVVSSVSQLIPMLVQSPIIFLNGQSLAQFLFAYRSNSMAGSHSTVTFWPGDSINSTMGPFNLHINFTRNSSINDPHLQYIYSSAGNYTVNFLVQNILNQSFIYTLNVQVIEGDLQGFYIQLSPDAVSIGQTVKINVFLELGSNVMYTCLINNVFYGSLAKSGRKNHLQKFYI
jgi:hypothetical protein